MASETQRTATLQLEFVVVGGGIGAHAIAYMLCIAGHKVHVLEKQPALGAPASGIRLPPNASKILKRWVGDEALRKTAANCLYSPWYDVESGERLGAAHWRPDVMTEAGGDFLLMAHEDVHRMVHELAVSAGAKVEFGATVEKVTPGERPSVTLEGGRVIEADIIIGADGPRSMVRDVVLGGKVPLEYDGMTAFGATLPISAMRNDPELSQMLKEGAWPLGMGTSRSICGHPTRAHTEFALMVHVTDEAAQTPPDAEESWLDVVSLDTVNLDGLSPTFMRLLKATSCLWRTRCTKPLEVTEWYDETERIVLLGEAAHPWYAGCSHGTAMALEDAVVLGKLFSYLTSPDQIPTFLHAYQEIRHSRTSAVRAREVTNAAILWLPPGPHRDGRDVVCRLDRQEWDEGALKEEFEGIVDMVGYDAYDAAEEWWVRWGRYKLFPGSERPISQMQIQFLSEEVRIH